MWATNKLANSLLTCTNREAVGNEHGANSSPTGWLVGELLALASGVRGGVEMRAPGSRSSHRPSRSRAQDAWRRPNQSADRRGALYQHQDRQRPRLQYPGRKLDVANRVQVAAIAQRLSPGSRCGSRRAAERDEAGIARWVAKEWRGSSKRPLGHSRRSRSSHGTVGAVVMGQLQSSRHQPSRQALGRCANRRSCR